MIWHQATNIVINDECITQANVHLVINPVKQAEPWILEVYRFLAGWADPDDSVELHTSGTTGEQKSMRVSKERMVHSARATGEFFGLGPGNIAFLPLSLTYIAGKMMLVRAITLGLTLHIVKPSSNPLSDSNCKPGYDFAAFVPLQLHAILSDPTSSGKLEQIRQIIVGGSDIDYGLRSRLRKMTNRIYETFGMTETLSHVALRQINHAEAFNLPFKALPGIKFSADERNCLMIEADRLLDHALVTNDIVDLIDEHSFYWLGRIDHVINSGSIKIVPEVLEKELEPFISDVFCIASIPDELLGQKMILIMEDANPDDRIIGQILRKMPEILPRYSVPREIYAIPDFNRNSHGKIVRKQLVERILSDNIQPVGTL